MTPTDDSVCDYCGLPLPTPLWRRSALRADSAPGYCCFGCRFAASVSGERGDEGESRLMLTRLGLAIFLTMNVMVFTLVLWSYDAYAIDDGRGSAGAWADLLRSLCILLSLPVLILLGKHILTSALADVRRGVTSTDLLILAGVAAAYGLSAIAVIQGTGSTYFEVGCMVLVFITLGRWFEATARLRASNALDALQQLLPAEVTVQTTRGRQRIARNELSLGDVLVVRPNERISTDGILLTGPTTVDEQVLTGESWPRTLHVGDFVQGGSLNLETEAWIRVTARPDEGTLARLIEAVRLARETKGRSTRLADRAAGIFLPTVIGIALVTFIGHSLTRGWGPGVLAGLSVLLVACPCAMGLATPLASWTALGRAARNRIVFRNSDALERLADVRAIRFDKTGTLTTGRPRVLRLHTECDAALVRQCAIQLAGMSRHPFCRAIRELGISMHAESEATEVCEQSGLGVSGWVRPDSRERREGAARAFLGSERFLNQQGLVMPDRLRAALDREERTGRPVAMIGWDGLVRGIFVFDESLRMHAPAAMAACRRLGLDVGGLTGDSPSRGRRIAHSLGIPVFAGLQPDQKVEHIRAAKRGGSVAMVGDGINDAPALTAADVGIAMGGGTDVARDSADVCLLVDDLTQIAWAIELSRRTVATMRQNLAWAFGYNSVAVLVATTGRLHPALAAGLMLASSVVVVFNSLKLNRGEPGGDLVSEEFAVDVSALRTFDKGAAADETAWPLREVAGEVG